MDAKVMLLPKNTGGGCPHKLGQLKTDANGGRGIADLSGLPRRGFSSQVN
jgi:hypothetical protein